MEAITEEEIPQPFLEASCYHFAPVNSLEIKHHYKMKFPESYCLDPVEVLDLLEHEDHYYKLNNSVKNFIRSVHKPCQKDRFKGCVENEPIQFLNENEQEKLVPETHARKKNSVFVEVDRVTNKQEVFIEVDRVTKKQEVFMQLTHNSSTADFVEKSAVKSRKPTCAVDVIEYDSVHSVKVPVRTYAYRKKIRQTLYQHNRQDMSKSAVSELTQQMNKLQFERVEKKILLSEFPENEACLSFSHSNMD